MILSHLHRFVFIKGLKVAGTSAEIAISQICGPADIVTPITPVDERHRVGTRGMPRNYCGDLEKERNYRQEVTDGSGETLGVLRSPRGTFFNHMSLGDVLEQVPESRDYRLLFVERSPYDKVISFANWHPNQRRYKAGQPLPKPTPDIIRAAVDSIIKDGTALKVRNIDLYRDQAGRIPTSGWRYDRLSDDLEAFFDTIGIAGPPLVHAKRGGGSSAHHPASTLRRDQLDFINRAFADEFAAFGYPLF
jgi:hypothetical protein